MTEFIFDKNLFISENTIMKKKIRKIFERFKIFLTEDEKYKLYKKLMEINSSKLI